MKDDGLLPDIDRVINVAEMYYHHGMTQEEIGVKISLSRTHVSRILRQAKELGIVSIRLQDPRQELIKSGDELERRFGLKKAIVVVGTGDEAMVRKRIGRAAARHIEDCLKPKSVLGIGRGLTAYDTVHSLSPNRAVPGLTCVPLAGGEGLFDSYYQTSEMARFAAEVLGGKCVYLTVPFYVSSARIKQALLQDESVVTCTELWERMDIALIGIGALGISGSPVLAEKGRKASDKAGRESMADICGRFLDECGKTVPEEPDVLMAVDLAHLRNISQVIAVAGGKKKAQAILATLRSEIVDVLVTDAICAGALLGT